MSDPAPEFETAVDEHDPLDVAAGCAGLLLLPANANHQERPSALMIHALRSTERHSAPVEHGSWQCWLGPGSPFGAGQAWDPPEGLFAHPILFVGGPHVAVPRGEVQAPFDLQQLLDALVLADWPAETRAFREPAIRLATAATRLTTVVAARAGLPRQAPIEDADELVIPNADRLAQLTAAVAFTSAEIEDLVSDDLTTLDAITHDLDDGPLPEPAGPDWPLDRTPLVRRGDRWVLCDTAALLTAVRHQIIVYAIENGQRDELARRTGALAIRRVIEACDRMNWSVQHQFTAPAGMPLTAVVFGMDFDKACHVVVVHDDLVDYDVDDAYAMWDPSGLDAAVQAQMRRAEDALTMGVDSPRINDMMHMVVVAGAGRPSVVGMTGGDSPLGAHHMLLSLEALNTITLVEHDELALFKCARAGDRLRSHARLMASNPLDEFAAWRSYGHSFYLSDDARPDFLSLAGDFGLALREEAARQTDVHAVVTPRGSTVAVVALFSDVPVYTPLQSRGRPELVVEDERAVVWVVAHDGPADGAHYRTTAQMVDTIAYWIWQFMPSLPLASHDAPRVIEVRVDDPEAWDLEHPPAASGPVAKTAVRRDGRVSVRVAKAILAKLNRGDNLAERELMGIVLAAIAQSEHKRGARKMTPREIGAAVDAHAPLGPKKKINVFSVSKSPALVNAGLAPYRPVQEADTNDLLDDLGPQLADRLGLQAGPIPADQRTLALNTAVDLCYQRMTALVATLSPHELLERLVALHESILHQVEFDRRTIGSRVAAYGETDLLAGLREELPKANNAAVSARFLIEYVVAVPPSGLRPFSLGVFDELMALASEITNRGMTSDVIKYKLDDIELSILESGRLGAERGTRYVTGQQAFLDAVVPAHLRAAAAGYARYWDDRPTERPDFADRLDAASMAEFGFTMTELVDLHTAIAALGFNRSNGQPTAMARDDFEAQLTATLGWTRARIAAGVGQLSLAPRPDFLKPPQPYDGTDVYPWRFNRALSYLRRPLLIRDGGREVVWGMRHVDMAGQHLLNLVVSDRLRATSSEMQHLMTELRQAETGGFNEMIADRYEDAGLLVRRNVSKIGGKRIARPNGQSIADIDVLVADTATRTLLLVECKDLEGARTPVELSNEISGTFGTGGKKPSAAEKHQERLQWVTERIPHTLEWLGISDEPDGWTASAIMVVDSAVMSPYVVDCPLPVLTAEEVLEKLGSPLGAAGLTGQGVVDTMGGPV